MRPGFVLLFFVWSGAALSGPYDGLYRPNYDWGESWDCSSVGSDGGAMAIGDDRITGIGTSCALSNPIDVRGMDAVLYDMDCTGTNGAQRSMILRHEFGVYVVTDGLVLDWLRCE